jgi:hypothetical protein
MQTDPISAAIAYRQALEQIARAPSLAAAVREAQRALTIAFSRPEEGQINISSGYGHNTKQAFVTFSLANPSESANPTIQLTSAAARQQAYYILEAADGADTDAFLVEWMRSAAFEEQAIGALLSEFRVWREAHRNKDNES